MAKTITRKKVYNKWKELEEKREEVSTKPEPKKEDPEGLSVTAGQRGP